MNLQGQAALVTGVASGLGAQTARELAKRGARRVADGAAVSRKLQFIHRRGTEFAELRRVQYKKVPE